MILAENMVVAGRFRLNRLLGRGGMGSIWHATHLGLDIPCALKFIEGHLADMADMNARFEREAKAAARLRSPHVVQILDHGIWEGTPYIAMELLEGEDLGKRLERVQKLSAADVVAVIDQVTRALGKAHAMGIVHRDLKPDNIFLVKDDDREIAKVLDFGIAKTTVELASGATKTGAMLGTPYYMSPEQAQGTKTLDLRSDLWALAVIVFECITGLRPFESEALGDLLMRIMVAPLPVPSQVASVPPGFDAWWARAAMRDPALRFQTAKELSDALALALGVTAKRPTVEMTEVSPLSATSVVAPPVTAVHAKLAATTGAAVARTQDGSSPTPALPKRSLAPIVFGAVGVGFAAAIAVFVAVRSKTPADPAHASPTSSVSTVAAAASNPATPGPGTSNTATQGASSPPADIPAPPSPSTPTPHAVEPAPPAAVAAPAPVSVRDAGPPTSPRGPRPAAPPASPTPPPPAAPAHPLGF